MRKVLSAVGISGILSLFPIIAFAQFGDISKTIVKVIEFINTTLVPLVFAIAFLVFLWGIFKAFILGGADETKRSEGRQLMLWAVIGFVLMVSIWGIVNVLASGLGFNKLDLQGIPRAPSVRPASPSSPSSSPPPPVVEDLLPPT